MVRSATLGKLFNTTKYGSATFDKKLDHHKIIAIAIPKVVPTKNPTTVSYTVTPICFNKTIISKDRKEYLRKIKKRKYLILLTQILILVSFLGIWEILADNGIIDSFITSQPSKI